MKRYPLKLTYIAKSAIWGGSRLALEWGKQGDGDNIAETWELSVREKEMAYIENGEAEGLSLRDYIRAAGADCVANDYSLDKPFPLLVKFIDAADRLSVQVHPDDAYAGERENDVGKTEMWYIVDADEGARIVCGLKDGVSESDFAQAVREGRTGEVLKSISVKKGESYFIPAGLVHAIGKGVLIAEIQQNSDLTYRVYDYDRVGKDGQKRPLHVDKALDVTRVWSADGIEKEAFAGGKTSCGGELLANGKYFSVCKHTVDGEIRLNVSEESFCHLLCIDGAAVIRVLGEKYEIKRGDSYFLPAGLGECSILGNAQIICSRV